MNFTADLGKSYNMAHRPDTLATPPSCQSRVAFSCGVKCACGENDG